MMAASRHLRHEIFKPRIALDEPQVSVSDRSVSMLSDQNLRSLFERAQLQHLLEEQKIQLQYARDEDALNVGRLL